MKRDYETDALAAVAEGSARRFDFADGYLVLQKWGDELFLLFIKWAPNKLDFRAMLDTLKAFALSEGCDKITGIGRRGWRRVLSKSGFHELDDGTLELNLKEH